MIISGKWLVWNEVLLVLMLQRELYELPGSTFAKALESQKFMVLLMYCAIPPARGRVMRHSRKEHTRTYDKKTLSDEVAFAVDLSATQASSALGIASYLAGPSTSGTSKTKKCKLLPSVGDIVALAEDTSSKQHPVILLCKVLRIYLDSCEVLLAHLKPVRKGKKIQARLQTYHWKRRLGRRVRLTGLPRRCCLQYS